MLLLNPAFLGMFSNERSVLILCGHLSMVLSLVEHDRSCEYF